MEKHATEILISAFRVTHPLDETHYLKDTYEFILDADLRIIECLKVILPARGIRKSMMGTHLNDNFLDGFLFELHHVRVNPKVNNEMIIQRLILALSDMGVSIQKQPHRQDMRICYKPLGEISECVRFYLSSRRKLVFLCPTKGPRLVTYCSNI